MDPFVALGSAAIGLLTGSACLSLGRWMTQALNRAARWWLATLGLGAAAGGTWYVWAHGSPEILMVTGLVTAAGTVFGCLTREQIGVKAVMLVTTGVVAEACAVGAWVLWYGRWLQPWSRAVAGGLGVGVGVYLAVLVLTALAQLLATGRWFHREIIGGGSGVRP